MTISFEKLLYSLHNGLALLHKYTSTRASDRERTNQRDIITCDTICVVDSKLSINYCLTRFTCILFLLLKYICFSIKPFVFPVSFFSQHHNKNISIVISKHCQHCLFCTLQPMGIFCSILFIQLNCDSHSG